MPPSSYWSSSWWNVAVLWSRASLCRICISHHFQITEPIRVIKSCQANSPGDSWRGTFTPALNSQSLFLQPPQYHNSRAVYKRRPNCGCFCHLVEWWLGWLHLLLDNRAEREGKKKKQSVRKRHASLFQYRFILWMQRWTEIVPIVIITLRHAFMLRLCYSH